MNFEGLTIYHVKSHLQECNFFYVKYLTKKQVLNSIDFANANVRNFRNTEQLDINQKHLKVPTKLGTHPYN